MMPAAAPLIVRIHICLWGVAIVRDYPHPAVQLVSYDSSSATILKVEIRYFNAAHFSV